MVLEAWLSLTQEITFLHWLASYLSWYQVDAPLWSPYAKAIGLDVPAVVDNKLIEDDEGPTLLCTQY